MVGCRELSSKAPDAGKPATAPGPKAVAKVPTAVFPGPRAGTVSQRREAVVKLR